MRFPNALSGVKKIFAAELLAMIGTVLMVVALVLGVIGGLKEDLVGLGGATIIGIVAGVLLLISYILYIVGVSKASKDEPAFKTALYVIVFGIVYSIITTTFSSAIEKSGIQQFANLIPDLINLVAMLFIVTGIRNLAEQLGDKAMITKGERIMKIAYVMEIIIFVIRAVSMFAFSNNEIVGTAVVVAAVVAGILNVVIYIMYLLYLGKAKKLLA